MDAERRRTAAQKDLVSLKVTELKDDDEDRRRTAC
jgi:hypothetical protein